jgi:hypothetical protein
MRGAKVRPRELARRLARAVGRGSLRFEFLKRRPVGSGKWEIGYRLGALGATPQESWLPVVQESGRWFVDTNPFAGIDLGPKRIALPVPAAPPAKHGQTPKLELDPKTGAVKITGLSG